MNRKKQKTVQKENYILLCERRWFYLVLTGVAGFFGAFTYLLRGNIFCNAQTGNIVLMGMALGAGQWQEALYYLIPISAYTAGAFLSELLPNPVKHHLQIRWDTLLIAIEMAVVLFLGFLPESAPVQISQIAINFIASMQYNTFRQAEGIPMATTFCTNHVRQVGVAAAKVLRKKDSAAAARGLLHAGMLACFLLGGTVLAAFCNTLGAKTIWVALIPMLTLLFRLVHADLTTEHDLLSRKPSGH